MNGAIFGLPGSDRFWQKRQSSSREEMDMAKAIQVTLVRSPIGHPEKHRKILKALGLTYLNKTVTLYSTPSIVGAIRKVIHFVEVNEAKM
jgi:large subunit ribosomal protein L30